MKKVLLAMMVAGAVFAAEAKPKTISNGARTAAVKKCKDEDIKKQFSKLKLQLNLYKKEKDKDKKAELKSQITQAMKEIDEKLAAVDPKYKKLLDKVNEENKKAEEKQ